MGAAASGASGLLPTFFIPYTVILDEDIELCKRSWEMITNDDSPSFRDYKASKEDTSERFPTSCLAWFHDW